MLKQNVQTLRSKIKDLATRRSIIQGDTMEEVWALKDVSFEPARREAVGIIGRNGAILGVARQEIIKNHCLFLLG